MNDIVLNKKESIERCLKQIRAYSALPGDIPFADDRMKQDAIAINLQRACEQAIDLANYTIKKKKLGFPKESKESFRLLADNKIIPPQLSVGLGKMVGFRNVLVHEYRELDPNIMLDVINNHLDELIDFTDHIMRAFPDTSAP